MAPVTSHGIIAFRVEETLDPTRVLAENETSITGFEEAKQLQFLLIQRRDSLGFVEMMKGKYPLDDYTYIMTQLKGFTKQERQRFLTLTFDELWNGMWGPSTNDTRYQTEKETSRSKFQSLRTVGLRCPDATVRSLPELFDTLGAGWDTPEWGFPKGRREVNETEQTCAVRELWEETGLGKEHITVIENCEPLQETFFGTNHVHYCHKYYLAFVKAQGPPLRYDPTNPYMKQEIGDVQWCTLEQALGKIRPENVEKREVLLRAQSLLRNYCPLLLN